MQSTAPSSTATPSTGTSSSMSGSANANGSANGSFNSSTNTSMTSPSSTTAPNNSSSSNFSTTNPNATTNTNVTQNGAQSTNQNTQTSSQINAGTTATVSNEQVTTFVQQLDTQGPAVVQQVSTQVGDLACSQDTVQNLVDALHSGQSVQITSNVNGQQQTATFNANGTHLGYGEAYLAIALAAQELRNAGVSMCATPEQWQAALLGGPLAVSTTSTTTNASASAGSTMQFPGIVTLHTQGQGWGEIAQSNNLQLSQVISNNTAGQATGFSSSQMNQGRVDANTPAPDSGNHTGEKKHHWWSLHKNKDKDTDADQNSTNSTPTDQNATGNTTTTPSTR